MEFTKQAEKKNVICLKQICSLSKFIHCVPTSSPLALREWTQLTEHLMLQDGSKVTAHSGWTSGFYGHWRVNVSRYAPWIGYHVEAPYQVSFLDQ